jgi:WD40 repeat protein
MNTHRTLCSFTWIAIGIAMFSGDQQAKADFVFGEPVDLRPGLSVLTSDVDIIDCFSADGLEIYMSSYRPGGYGDADLYVARRASIDHDWEPPENLGSQVNTSVEDSCSSISSDGLTLYFSSDRPGGSGGYDVYMTTRATRNDPWGPATNLGPTVNSSATDGEAAIAPNGLELYFESRRAGGQGEHDIYVVRRQAEDEPWGPPENLGPVVNTAYREQSLSLLPDGLLLLFSDHPRFGVPRPGGHGGADMWMTRRASLADPWQAPVNLGPQVNGSGADAAPRISPDGSALYFVTRRPDGGYDNLQAPIIPIVDFDGDGLVDSVDIDIMIDCWGTDDSLCDIGPMPWGDGVVDVEDLIVLVEHIVENRAAVDDTDEVD